MSKELKIGLVGATGLVGQIFLQALSEREASEKIKINELRPFASEQSLGKKISFLGQELPIQTLSDGCFKGLDFVFFSGGNEVSRIWAPKAVQEGAWAIDNSSEFRMNPNIELIVPEVNGDNLKNYKSPQVIANPNCSTIQLVVLLKPLLDHFGLEQVIVSTYQASSGAGREPQQELLDHMRRYPYESEGLDPQNKSDYFGQSLCLNVMPMISSVEASGFTGEELKVINESKKILNHKFLISAFAVRVPVLNVHSEAVWVRFNKMISKEQMFLALQNAKGLKLIDSNQNVDMPTPLTVTGKEEVYVSRVHQDIDDPSTWIFWVVADNLRKGAATNGIQIAEMIMG